MRAGQAQGACWPVALLLALAVLPARAADTSGEYGEIIAGASEASAPTSWLLLGRAVPGEMSYLASHGESVWRDESMVGYRWRKFSFEQLSSVPGPEGARAGSYKTRISRLSYKPAENLVVQLARGKISGLDYLMADESLKRTAVSASFRYDIAGAPGESLLAWGRSSGKMRQSTSGFLFESVVRVADTHTIFGRLEQVGSDDPGLDADRAGRTWSRLNRLSLGYVREFSGPAGAQLQLGGYVSHYRLPDEGRQAGATLYMAVVRLRLR